MRVRLCVVLLAFASAIGAWAEGAAQPQLPSSFFGTASIDGQPAPNGTQVRGLIDGIDCTQAETGGTAVDGGVAGYVIHVVHESQRPGCGNDTKTVTFTIGGRPAAQTAKWKVGPQELNLNAGSGEPAPLPTATSTRPGGASTTGAGTPAGAVLTATRPNAPTGTPPTDDVTFVTPKPPGANGDLPAAPDDGGAPVGLFLLLGFLAFAVGGGMIGVVMSRRPRPPDSSEPAGGPPPDGAP